MKYLTSLDALHHFGVPGLTVRHVPAGEDLPAEDPVGPNVALAGEPGEVQYLEDKNNKSLGFIFSQLVSSQLVCFHLKLIWFGSEAGLCC